MKIKFRLVFGQFSISSWSEKGHEPSWAENPSARAMARASSAWTHHYFTWYTITVIKSILGAIGLMYLTLIARFWMSRKVRFVPLHCANSKIPWPFLEQNKRELLSKHATLGTLHNLHWISKEEGRLEYDLSVDSLMAYFKNSKSYIYSFENS